MINFELNIYQIVSRVNLILLDDEIGEKKIFKSFALSFLKNFKITYFLKSFIFSCFFINNAKLNMKKILIKNK